MIEDCKNEIESIHNFFEQWLNGIIKPSKKNFLRIVKALATEFQLITPSGDLLSRDELLARFEKSYGTRKDNPMFIWTKGFTFKKLNPNYMVVIYQEWRKISDVEKGRISTAIFRRNGLAPNKVEWIHLQETWLTE